MASGPEQLKAWIERMKFRTYTDAAEYLGVNKSVVTKLVNGDRLAGLNIALMIERKTGIPVECWSSDPEDGLVTANPKSARKPKTDKSSTVKSVG